jgi:hypothetical protein
VRPRRVAGTTLVETTGRRTSAAFGTSGTTTASKLVRVWGTPSSLTTKSSRVRPETGCPFLSRITTSTVTASTRDAKVGAWARTLALATRHAHAAVARAGPSPGFMTAL